MSGRQRGGRIWRGKQHLPRNSTTSSPSAAPPHDSSSPTARRQSAIHSYLPSTRKQSKRLFYVPPPLFPDLGVPSTGEDGALDTTPAIISPTTPDDVFHSPLKLKQTLAPESQTPEDTQVKVTSTPKKTPEKQRRKTSGRARRTRGKRPSGGRRTPGRISGNRRVICGNCKLPRNHMMTPSPASKNKDEERGSKHEDREGDGERKYKESDAESLICECNEEDERKRNQKRNSYVEGEAPGTP